MMDGFLYDRTHGSLATRNSYLTSMKFLSELLSFGISIREFRPVNWCVCVCVCVCVYIVLCFQENFNPLNSVFINYTNINLIDIFDILLAFLDVVLLQ